MKIVVLDGYTMNPGDLSWEGLEGLGECTVYDRTPPEEVLARAAGAEIVLTNKVVFDGAVMARLPALKYIGVLATGYNIIDTAAARERGIVVTNVPAYSTRSVAQLVMALVLELAHHVGHHARTVREGRWTASKDFAYWDYPLVELDGLVMGIVGFGQTGRAVADLARAFGMHVLVHTRTPTAGPSVEFVDLATLLRRSDVVSLHCPLTPETEGLVNAGRLALMKPTALLINTSRGPVVNERDLAEALSAGRIAGAGLDVLSTEPPKADNPLLAAKNCFITPHIAWATRAARERLMKTVVANVRAFLAGRPQNVVNG
ncbi:MAG TPA: D-2-hydroxyacid dehydrogenase [Phycisphaerae bacterium]|nr:D-2-hydroxyacid dehydrogenase [Phycisphaerae bacterium]